MCNIPSCLCHTHSSTIKHIHSAVYYKNQSMYQWQVSRPTRGANLRQKPTPKPATNFCFSVWLWKKSAHKTKKKMTQQRKYWHQNQILNQQQKNPKHQKVKYLYQTSKVSSLLHKSLKLQIKHFDSCLSNFNKKYLKFQFVFFPNFWSHRTTSENFTTLTNLQTIKLYDQLNKSL